mgnify:CR=1 FL=1
MRVGDVGASLCPAACAVTGIQHSIMARQTIKIDFLCGEIKIRNKKGRKILNPPLSTCKVYNLFHYHIACIQQFLTNGCYMFLVSGFHNDTKGTSGDICTLTISLMMYRNYISSLLCGVFLFKVCFCILISGDAFRVQRAALFFHKINAALECVAKGPGPDPAFPARAGRLRRASRARRWSYRPNR